MFALYLTLFVALCYHRGE